MNLETKITIYKFTPQVFTLTRNNQSGTKVSWRIYKAWQYPNGKNELFGVKRRSIENSFS